MIVLLRRSTQLSYSRIETESIDLAFLCHFGTVGDNYLSWHCSETEYFPGIWHTFHLAARMQLVVRNAKQLTHWVLSNIHAAAKVRPIKVRSNLDGQTIWSRVEGRSKAGCSTKPVIIGKKGFIARIAIIKRPADCGPSQGIAGIA